MLKNKRRCVIISAAPQCDIPPLSGEDFVIVCDGGLHHARRANITPDLVLGDFDSFVGEVGDLPTLRAPAQKDDTDTMLAIKQGLSLGFDSFLLLGALGGRLDHTLANLASAFYIADRGGRCVIYSEDALVYPVKDGELVLPRRKGYSASVFAWGGDAEGVTLRGMKYPLENASLPCCFPLGVSNEILAPEGVVSVRRGRLLVVLSSLGKEKKYV